MIRGCCVPATVVFCDFDGTITQRDVWDGIVQRFDPHDWAALVSFTTFAEILNSPRLAKFLGPPEEATP